MPKEKLRMGLSVEFDPRAKTSTPVRTELDFAPWLNEKGSTRLVDPHSIVIMRRVSGKTRTYSVQIDERLYSGNRGWVAWLADSPEDGGEWWLEFSPRDKSGKLAKAPYFPMVGVGDEVHYNGLGPISAQGRHAMPLTVDWDGDGLVDIICASHHSNTIGMPWAGVFFWKNLGTNEKPRFAVPMRLYADGVDQIQMNGLMKKIKPRRENISEDYMGCDVFDWYGTGRKDLITISRTGGIKVYRNTGRLDAAGLPVLELSERIRFPSCLVVGRYLQVKVRDWDGSGRPSMILASVYHDKFTNHQGEQIILMLNQGKSRMKSRTGSRTSSQSPDKWKFKSFPFTVSGARLGYDVHIQNWKKSNFSNHRSLSIDAFDIDGDGSLEIFCCHVKHLSSPVIEMWKNVGSVEEPALMYRGVLPWSFDPMAFGFHFTRDAAFDGCIRASWYNDAGFRYFKKVGDDPLDPKSYRDAGLLLGNGCKVKHEGMVKGNPIVRNGVFDLLCGDLAGFITLVRNKGKPDRPVFSAPEKVTDKHGQDVRVYREDIMPDNNSERNCGQLKPCLCDWDGDGKLDILVGNNTNKIVWLKAYDPETNQYRQRRRLQVKGLMDPFGFRKGPAVADFDGDGRLELVTVDSLGRVCLYKQGKGPDGPSNLEPPVPLVFTNGKTIMNSDIGRALAAAEGVKFPEGIPGLWKEPSITFAVCDWTGNGTYDLAISSNWYTFILENRGSNKSPRFKKPWPVRGADSKPCKISQHESHVTAYDWDGDGRPDLIIGGESGSLYLFHHDWVSGIRHKVRFKTPSK